MCSMSVHYNIQKTLITNKCTKSFFINYNTLLHLSTLLGHLQGELFCYRYTKVARHKKRLRIIDLVPSVRMSGTMPLLVPYAFIACTETICVNLT
jgi:hypothetical protein